METDSMSRGKGNGKGKNLRDGKGLRAGKSAAETVGTTKALNHQGKPLIQESPGSTVVVETGDAQTAKPLSHQSESDAQKLPEPAVVAKTARPPSGQGKSNTVKSLESIVAKTNDATARPPNDRGESNTLTLPESVANKRSHDQDESTIDNAPRRLVIEQEFDHFACPVDGEGENQMWGLSWQGRQKPASSQDSVDDATETSISPTMTRETITDTGRSVVEYNLKRNRKTSSSSNSPPRPRHSRTVYSATLQGGEKKADDGTEEPPRKLLRADRDVCGLVFPRAATRNSWK